MVSVLGTSTLIGRGDNVVAPDSQNKNEEESEAKRQNCEKNQKNLLSSDEINESEQKQEWGGAGVKSNISNYVAQDTETLNVEPEELVKQALPHQAWQRDSEVEVCTECRETFTFRRRRHHCRKCGKIYCNSCAPHRGHLRLCTSCHDTIPPTVLHCPLNVCGPRDIMPDILDKLKSSTNGQPR